MSNTKRPLENQVINISICLSDIPKSKIKKGKNGKLYTNIDVKGRKEDDRYGNSLTVLVSKTKEEREAKEDNVYIGSGNLIDFTGGVEKVDDMEVMGDNDDLPF